MIYIDLIDLSGLPTTRIWKKVPILLEIIGEKKTAIFHFLEI